jgi:tripartite-type tricarboxylate transporter receptor subunit TctC
MTVTRRTVLGTLALSLSGLPFTARAEDAWPSRMVRLISPYGPGGSNDISLRLLAEEFGRNLH